MSLLNILVMLNRIRQKIPAAWQKFSMCKASVLLCIMQKVDLCSFFQVFTEGYGDCIHIKASQKIVYKFDLEYQKSPEKDMMSKGIWPFLADNKLIYCEHNAKARANQLVGLWLRSENNEAGGLFFFIFLAF